MQIASWNVNSLKVRLTQVLDWLVSSNCDVLALQELKLENHAFPSAAFAALGYNAIFNGQKTYNGVALIVKKHLTLSEIVFDMPHFADEQKRVITATVTNVTVAFRIMCVYVVNGQSLDSDKYQYKLHWLKQLYAYVQLNLQQYDKFILLGDFNIAPEDRDVYKPEIFVNQILCSELERHEWRRLIALGLYDSFRLFNQDSGYYSWWDYRNFAFRRKLGLRIDHILINEPVKQLATVCNIDTTPRQHERPSDHAPVVLYTLCLC